MASDASTLQLMESMLTTLKAMASQDPVRCYGYLFPSAAEAPVVIREEEGRSEMMAAMLNVVGSARGDGNPVQEGAAETLLEDVMSRVGEKHGDDLVFLQEPQRPGVDRAKVCEMTIDLYAEVLALEPEDAADVLRFMFAE